MVSSQEQNFDVNCEYVERALKEEFLKSNVTLTAVVHPDIGDLVDTMDSIRKQGRSE